MKVITRFAPSPTGYLHVGGIRTALFAWLLARQSNGSFILRFEDTDKNREVAGAKDHIKESLTSLGLDWDQGPYRQSERLDIYRRWAKQLIDSGRAYADPYTKAEVDELRAQAQKNNQPFLYRNHRPDNPAGWDGKQPLRFKSEPKAYKWQDAVMGELSTGPEVIDDFILIKSDGYPTYNFAHIVDDTEMKVSHIIRGQEFLASVPNYLNLYEALNIKPPIMATMPHVLGPDGNKKLSKRDGAKDVLDYIREGFLPDALINFIASLGWNDGTEQEIFSREELIKKFSLEHVGRSGARFDETRLAWMNGHYIRELSLEGLAKLSEDYWPAEAKASDPDYKKAVLALVQERIKYLAELGELTSFFFDEPNYKTIEQMFDSPTDKQLKTIEKPAIKKHLEAALEELTASDFSEKDIESRLNRLLATLNSKPGVLFAIIRIAVTGAPASPQIFGTLAVLGKEKSLARIEQALKLFEKDRPDR